MVGTQSDSMPLRWLKAIAGVLLIAAMAPIALVVNVSLRLFGIKGSKRTADELASTLRRFADGAEDPYDWDDLECGGPIRDPRLEAIRQEAMTVDLPLRPKDRAKLGELAVRAEAVRQQP
jgi:hypothetical protein